MKKTRLSSTLFAFVLLVLIASCQQPQVFSEKKVFENQIWNRFDFLEYDFLIENPDITYDVSLGFTHLNAYYTDHLTANITFFMPDGSMRSRDYTFKLKNAQLEWLGLNEKGIINHQLSVIEGIKFPEKGNYKIRIESKMPKFNLEHIKTVELIISPSK